MAKARAPMKPGDPRARPLRLPGSVWVSGGTGFLGRAVCALLQRRGPYRVLAHRRRADLDGAWFVDGDVTMSTGLATSMEGASRVLHLAGAPRGRDPDGLRRLHVDGARNVLRAAREAGVSRVVAISSDTVHRARRSPYADSKASMEVVLREERGDIDVIVLRPGMMLGPGSPHEAALLRLAGWPLLPPLPDEPRWPVYVDDVGAAVIVAMDLPIEGAGFRAFDLPGAEPLTLDALIARLAGRTPRRLPLPRASLGAVAAFAAALGQPRLQDAIRGGGAPPDAGPARETLGWSPRAVGRCQDLTLDSKRAVSGLDT